MIIVSSDHPVNQNKQKSKIFHRLLSERRRKLKSVIGRINNGDSYGSWMTFRPRRHADVLKKKKKSTVFIGYGGILQDSGS